MPLSARNSSLFGVDQVMLASLFTVICPTDPVLGADDVFTSTLLAASWLFNCVSVRATGPVALGSNIAPLGGSAGLLCGKVLVDVGDAEWTIVTSSGSSSSVPT